MNIKAAVKWWFFTGALMIFVQIILGGITRLTGSGLSITEWEVIRGTIPPLNANQWENSFNLYKSTPQYMKINEGMSINEFKGIYFWEYFHRTWARLMGFVFVLPLTYFFIKKWIPKRLIISLLIIFFGAFLVAFFGWVMVDSGLQDRPWVNAYSLSVHLVLALSLYGFILYTFFKEFYRGINTKEIKHNRLQISLLVILVCVQIIFGAWMSGMHAALNFPTWPDMNGQVLPGILGQRSQWKFVNMVNYDGLSTFAPALVQVMHRFLGYVLYILISFLFFRNYGKLNYRRTKNAWISLYLVCNVQVLLGIFTLLASKGTIPVILGSLHQGIGILLLSLVLFLFFTTRNKPNN